MAILDGLLYSINNKWVTIGMLVAFHCAVVTLPVHKIFLVSILVYTTIFTLKMFTFHSIAIGESAKLEKGIDKAIFQRDTLAICCISMVLELFGHVLITVISGMGYYLYV